MSQSLLLPLALAWSPAALAVPGDVVEFQIATDTLGQLVRERAKFVHPGCPTEITSGLYVDHFQFGAPSIATSGTRTVSLSVGTLTAPLPVLDLPVTAHLASFASAWDPAGTDTIPFDLVLRFGLDTTGGDVCASYLGPKESLGEEIDAALAAQMADLGDLCAPVDTSALTDLLGPGVVAVDTALALSSDGARVAVRMGMGGPLTGSAAQWQTFLDGDVVPNTGGDFLVFVHQALLGGHLAGVVLASMACDPSDPGSPGCTDGVEPTAIPGYTWAANPPTVGVIAPVSSHQDGCVFDIDANLLLSGAVGLNGAGDALSLDLAADVDVDEGDVVGCILLNAFLPFVPVVDLIQGVIEDEHAGDPSLPGDCTQTGDQSATCELPFALPALSLGSGPIASLHATSVSGTADGLRLEGDATLGGALTNDSEGVALVAEPMSFGIQGGCSAGPYLGFQGGVEVADGGAYCANPETGADSPELRPETNPLGVFGVDPFSVGVGAPDSVSIDFPWADTGPYYGGNAYPAIVTVWTTNGSGSVDLGSAPPLPDLGPNSPWLADLAEAIADCMVQAPQGPQGWLDVQWLIDPPDWNLVVAGGDPAWSRATVALLAPSLVATSAPAFDPRTGLASYRAGQLSLQGTLFIDAGTAGQVRTEVAVPLGGAFSGPRAGSGAVDVVTPSSSVAVRLDVPRAALPTGVTALTVSSTLDAGDLAAGGAPLAR